MGDPRTYREVEYDGHIWLSCDWCSFLHDPKAPDGLPNHVGWCERDAERVARLAEPRP
jgi:hypothetical protein